MSNQYDDGGESFYSECGSPEEEARRLKQRKLEYRKLVRHNCSIIGFSLAAMILLSQLVGLVVWGVSSYLAAHAVMGVGGELFKMIHSDWFNVAGINLLSYALVIPVMMSMLEQVPEERIERKKMRLGKFLMFLVLIFGLGYLSNMAGSAINSVLARMVGRKVSDMAPIGEMLKHLNWSTAIYISLIGPVIEEFVFRWLILNRLRPMGDKAAILFSALMFGLMHGNISQFFYAAAIGIVFGYIAVKTGRIFYSAILHIIFNSFSTILAGSMIVGSNLGFFYYAIILAVPVIMAGTIIGAIVIVLVNRKKTRLQRGNWPDGVEYRDFSSAMFLNPGVGVFSLLCLAMACFYIFLA